MASKFYGGTPGSGKSYEVVENVILPGLKDGRRVVTNIAGLDYEAMVEYLVERGADPDKIGTIHKIELTEKIEGKLAIIRGDGEHAQLDPASIVQGGDLCVFDEVWRIWEEGKRIHADDQKFLRMQRHLLHPKTNVACDVIVISQDFADLNRTLKRLIEERYIMSKHISIGKPNRYRVSVYSKGSRRSHVQYQKKYDPKIFPLYKSHSMGAGNGVEKSVDGRGNILKGAMFTIVLPLALLLGGGGMYGVYRFFHSADPEPAPSSAAKDQSGRAMPSSSLPAALTVRAGPDLKPPPPVSPANDWKIYGRYVLGPTTVIVLQNLDGRLRYITNPDDVSIGINDVTVTLDGVKMTYYSAAFAPAARTPPGPYRDAGAFPISPHPK